MPGPPLPASHIDEDLQRERERAIGWEGKFNEERTKRYAAEAKAKELQSDWADLKIRLHAAEKANQYMRGYIARVQEDDVVREELVTVGDPAGEQHLRPKRKPTEFQTPDDFRMPAHTDNYGRFLNDSDRRGKARHWITY